MNPTKKVEANPDAQDGKAVPVFFSNSLLGVVGGPLLGKISRIYQLFPLAI